MRYFIDTEFIENGKTIELISIGIVSSDGREYYAISTEFDPAKASPWVKTNVLTQLPPRAPKPLMSPRLQEESKAWKNRELIAIEVMAFMKGVDIADTPCGDFRKLARSPLQFKLARLIGQGGIRYHPQSGIQDLIALDCPEFEVWADYASYDWVVLCQLFGTMMDLPNGFPMYCHDLRQECDRLNVTSSELPIQSDGQHSALSDARWVQAAWEYLRDRG